MRSSVASVSNINKAAGSSAGNNNNNSSSNSTGSNKKPPPAPLSNREIKRRKNAISGWTPSIGGSSAATPMTAATPPDTPKNSRTGSSSGGPIDGARKGGLTVGSGGSAGSNGGPDEGRKKSPEKIKGRDSENSRGEPDGRIHCDQNIKPLNFSDHRSKPDSIESLLSSSQAGAGHANVGGNQSDGDIGTKDSGGGNGGNDKKNGGVNGDAVIAALRKTLSVESVEEEGNPIQEASPPVTKSDSGLQGSEPAEGSTSTRSPPVTITKSPELSFTKSNPDVVYQATGMMTGSGAVASDSGACDTGAEGSGETSEAAGETGGEATGEGESLVVSLEGAVNGAEASKGDQEGKEALGDKKDGDKKEDGDSPTKKEKKETVSKPSSPPRKHNTKKPFVSAFKIPTFQEDVRGLYFSRPFSDRPLRRRMY